MWNWFLLSKIRKVEYLPIVSDGHGITRKSSSAHLFLLFFWEGMNPIQINNCIHQGLHNIIYWQTHAIKKHADSWSLLQPQATACPCVSTKQWKSLLSCPKALASPSIVTQPRLTHKHPFPLPWSTSPLASITLVWKRSWNVRPRTADC